MPSILTCDLFVCLIFSSVLGWCRHAKYKGCWAATLQTQEHWLYLRWMVSFYLLQFIVNTSTNSLSCLVFMFETSACTSDFTIFEGNKYLNWAYVHLASFFTGTRSMTKARQRKYGNQSKTLAGQTPSRRRQTTYRSGGWNRNPTKASLGTSLTP